jgi:CheY-like chemotaxis protein
MSETNSPIYRNLRLPNITLGLAKKLLIDEVVATSCKVYETKIGGTTNEKRSPSGGPMKTILVLEDESLVVKLYRLILRGYRILEAPTVADAVRQFRDSGRHVDLLLTDLTLASGSAAQLGLLLRSRGSDPAVPVILASGFSLTNQAQQHPEALMGLGKDSVRIIEKPFFPSVLLHKVHEMIGAPG